MFSVEIRINGTLISNINCKNVTDPNTDSDENLYLYECYTYEKDIIKNVVAHVKSDGIHKLVGKILSQVSKKLIK